MRGDSTADILLEAAQKRSEVQRLHSTQHCVNFALAVARDGRCALDARERKSLRDAAAKEKARHRMPLLYSNAGLVDVWLVHQPFSTDGGEFSPDAAFEFVHKDWQHSSAPECVIPAPSRL